MKKLKSLSVVTMTAVMALTSAGYGVGNVSAANTSPFNMVTLDTQKPAANLPAKFVNPESPKKEVRVIIELEKAPAIEEATKKGVLYKSLPENQRESLEAAVESNQASVQSKIAQVAPRITYLESFTTVFNGFSATVEAGQVEKIANLNGVKAVYESTEYQRPEAKPEMKYSKELVQAQQVWNDYEYKGEEMVIGVIDTGIDPSHKDMVLTDDSTGAITKSEVDGLLADESLENGKYFTAKVPFGYNYMDGNDEILDLGPEASMHGMHVAGTVAANGNEGKSLEENGGVQGVAPEAQVLALKVFGNDPKYPSTYGDIYIKAIDDSIKLGADVINMSLGSTAGFVDSSNPEQEAVARATENGILVSISAGNSNLFGSGYANPSTANQDYGLTGSPSVSEDSFGVASFENDVVTAFSFGYSVDGAAKRGMYLLANDADPRDLPNASYEVVDAGFGTPADFAGKDLTGKVALVSRGDISFVEKGINAQNAGAAAVVVYNNTTGTISMQSDAAIKIPFMSALQSDGLAMKAELAAGDPVTVSFDGKYLEAQNPSAGKMSDFTSWGPTPNLDFKPEITAPGGNIFSTFNDNEYGLMSGTSMAAPHVSGGTALVFQRMNELGLEGEDRVQFAKNLIMNTADPVELEPGEYVSPRRQGAGLMQLHDALSTDVVVTNKETDEAKVALKEIGNTFSFTLTAENFDDEEAEYNLDLNVLVDEPAKTTTGELINAPNILGSLDITEDVTVTAPETVTVPANGTVDIPVTVTIPDDVDADLDDVYENGYFVDGFVTLDDENNDVTNNPRLNVPFFGFNGGWDDANVIDKAAWDKDSFYGNTLLADEKGVYLKGGTHETGFISDRFAFSPNGDGSRDQVVPVYSLLRNAKRFEVNVLDAEGNKLRTIRTGTDFTKHYSATAAYSFSPLNAWDGKVLGKQVADGNYQIQLRAVIDYEGAEWQSIEFPVKVDTVKPEAQAKYNTATKTVEVSSFTDNVGTDRWEVHLNGVALTDNAATKDVVESLSPATTSFAVTPELKKGDDLKAVFYDTAGNKTEVALSVAAPETVEPVIFFDSPDVLSIHKTNEVVVAGTVEDASKIVSLTVNGEKAAEFDGSKFKHTLKLADGSQHVSVKAVDEFGNEMELRRQVLVDTKAPTVTEVKVPKTVKHDQKEVEVTFNVKDNLDQIYAYLYDSEVFRKELSEPYGGKAFDQNITFKVPVVKAGTNEYTFVVKDAAGHETKQTFTITKEEKAVVTFSDIQTHWAKKEIEELATLGIIKGQTEKLFAPESKLTREQMAVLIVRALDLPLENYKGTFSDVTTKNWAHKEIEAAAKAGIINGTGKGKFDPKANISRQDTAVMMIRTVEFEDESLLDVVKGKDDFKDSSEIADYAKEYVAQAVELELIKGRPGNKFDPKAEITRAETATVLHRGLDKLDLLK